MANSYDINYDDERLTAVENERQDALNENEQLYSGMISDTDKYYQDQIQASKDWADTQTKLQQENTDFAISQIEQQKEQAQKDYAKEQSGAYVDWQKQSNRYGANAEQMAAAGMSGTGYSESAQVSMYNTYQNRVSTARESYNQAVLNYNNSIKEAQLQNNSILAEIAYQSLQQQLELSLAGFQYKNQLILDQANRKTELDNIYYQKYQDVLDQINTENAMAESVRQYNENLALEKAQLEESKRQFDLELEEKKRQFDEQMGKLLIDEGVGSGTGGGSESISVGYTFTDPETLESIRALGLGDISPEQLENLVFIGAVEEYTEKGITKFRPSGSVKENSTSTTNTSSVGPQIGVTAALDATRESIKALGYGNISLSAVLKLVESGEVEQYKENGVIKFRRTNKKPIGKYYSKKHGGFGGKDTDVLVN